MYEKSIYRKLKCVYCFFKNTFAQAYLIKVCVYMFVYTVKKNKHFIGVDIFIKYDAQFIN